MSANKTKTFKDIVKETEEYFKKLHDEFDPASGITFDFYGAYQTEDLSGGEPPASNAEVMGHIDMEVIVNHKVRVDVRHLFHDMIPSSAEEFARMTGREPVSSAWGYGDHDILQGYGEYMELYELAERVRDDEAETSVYSAWDNNGFGYHNLIRTSKDLPRMLKSEQEYVTYEIPASLRGYGNIHAGNVYGDSDSATYSAICDELLAAHEEIERSTRESLHIDTDVYAHLLIALDKSMHEYGEH